MPLPTSLHAYSAELSAFERAMAAGRGIRIGPLSRQAAKHFQFRCNQARILDRRKNSEAASPGDPIFGRSEFDTITCRIREDTEGSWWVYLQKNEELPGGVEEIMDDV